MMIEAKRKPEKRNWYGLLTPPAGRRRREPLWLRYALDLLLLMAVGFAAGVIGGCLLGSQSVISSRPTKSEAPSLHDGGRLGLATDAPRSGSRFDA